MIPEVLLLALLASTPPDGVKVGPATMYWPRDGHCGTERADGKRFTSKDSHIAHRTLPLGTVGFLCGRRGCVLTSVQDRGPFGQLDARKRWRARTRLAKGWRWRGEFDVTRPAGRAIRHRGFEVLRFYYWRKDPVRKEV